MQWCHHWSSCNHSSTNSQSGSNFWAHDQAIVSSGSLIGRLALEIGGGGGIPLWPVFLWVTQSKWIECFGSGASSPTQFFAVPETIIFTISLRSSHSSPSAVSAPWLAACQGASQTCPTVSSGDPHFHARARSGATHFHARARSPVSHFAAAQTYQNLGWVPPPPPGCCVYCFLTFRRPSNHLFVIPRPSMSVALLTSSNADTT